MLTGPAGSGKEMAARYIHAHSDRATGPFVVVNSAAIERRADGGGAVRPRKPPSAASSRACWSRRTPACVYFDEVADMPPGTQSKILRVLVDQQFQRVGGGDTVRVDVRVISATTRDLAREVAAGRFRQELYHRLNVVPIAVPGLEARRDGRAGARPAFPRRAQRAPRACALAHADARGRGAAADDALAGQRAPAAQHAGAHADPRLRPRADRAGGTGRRDAGVGRRRRARCSAQRSPASPLREAREVFEREYLLTQINRFGGNISRTATFVGMERSALHRKLKSLNVISAPKPGRRSASATPGG